jgi:hypothetical protein
VSKAPLTVREFLGVGSGRGSSFSRVALKRQPVVSPKWKFGQEKNSFIEQVVKQRSKSPAIGTYSPKGPGFSSQMGKINKGKAISYLSQIERHAKAVPSPNAYNTMIKDHTKLGKMDNSSRLSFVTDSEFLAMSGPSPCDHKDNAKDFTLPKVKSSVFSPLKKTETKGWRVAKKDGPAPGSYNTDRGLGLTKQSSTGWKIGTEKRKGIPSRGKKNQTPAPDAYSSIDFSKIHKRSTFRGRY